MSSSRGYRDDHAAALGQVAALEKELADSDEKLEHKERELARLQLRILNLEQAMAAEETNQALEPLKSHEHEKWQQDNSSTTTSYPEDTGERWWHFLLLPFTLVHLSWETTGWFGRLGMIAITGMVVLLCVISIRDCARRKAMDHRATLSWDAEVTASRGHKLTAGTACEVNAALASDRERAFGPEWIRITCGGHQVYDWLDRAHLISGDDAPRPHKRCTVLQQQRTAEGSHRYQLSCADVKGRVGGRPELSLETGSGQLMIWSETPPITRLELKVEQWSRPLKGAPLLAGVKGEQPGYW